MTLSQFIFIALVYLISAIPFSLVFAVIINGVDVRLFGDGNPGAYNAWHFSSKIAGILGVIFDVLKGALPVYFAKSYWPDSELTLMLSSILAVSGHAWSIYLGFHGGKSLAVTAGVFLLIFDALIAFTWFIELGLLRSLKLPFSICVVLTLLSASIYSLLTPHSWFLKITVIVISLIVTFKHKDSLIIAFQNNKSFSIDLSKSRSPIKVFFKNYFNK